MQVFEIFTVRIKIITDSTCNLSKNLVKKYDIEVIPAFVIIDDEEILDDGSIPPHVFYEKIDKSKRSMTSLSTPKLIWDAIDRNKDYDHLLMIHVGGKLSGYIGAVTNVVKQYKAQNENSPEITIYDSEGVSLLLGYLAIKAKQLADKGVKFDEIINQLDYMRENDLKVFMMVTTLKRIYAGGRISRATYLIGDLLHAHPILSIVDGKLVPIGKEFGFDRAIKKIIELFQSSFEEDDEVLVSFPQTVPRERNDKFRKKIEKLKTPKITDIYDFYIGNIITCHTGTDVYGLVLARNFKL